MKITPKLLRNTFLFIVLVPIFIVFAANGGIGFNGTTPGVDKATRVALTVIIQDRYEEEAMLIAREAGAASGTIVHGKNIYGVGLEENVSILLYILTRSSAKETMAALEERFDFSNPETNNGFAYTQSLTSVIGVYTQELE